MSLEKTHNKEQELPMQNSHLNIPINLILEEFYFSYLGKGQVDYKGDANSKVVMHHSLDNLIFFSEDKEVNNYKITEFGDRIFNLEDSTYKGFHELYCDAVSRIEYKESDRRRLKRDDLIAERKELEDKLKDDTLSNVRKQIYQEDKKDLDRKLKIIKQSHTKSKIEEAKKYCQMQNDDIAKDARKDVLFMPIKETSNSDTSYAPKIDFEMTVSKEITQSGKSNSEETVKEEPMFSQFHKVEFTQGDIQRTGDVQVSFKNIIAVPIEFPWFDSSVLQFPISEGAEQSFSSDIKFCRIPHKIIIGEKPIITYKEHNQVDDTIIQYTIPEDSSVILGYELDSSLCDSPLLSSFAKIAGDSDENYKEDL